MLSPYYFVFSVLRLKVVHDIYLLAINDHLAFTYIIFRLSIFIFFISSVVLMLIFVNFENALYDHKMNHPHQSRKSLQRYLWFHFMLRLV